MYTFQREAIPDDSPFHTWIANNPQADILVFTFLNGQLAQYSMDVPPGVIRRITWYAADTETDHEDVGWQVWVDNAIVIPTLQQGAGGYEIPIAGIAAVSFIEPNYPIMKTGKLTVACNGLANLTSGFTVIIEYIEMDIARAHTKAKRTIAERKEK